MDEQKREHHEIPEDDNPWEGVLDDDDDAGPPPRHPVAELGPGLLGALPSGANAFRYISDILGTVFRFSKIPISLGLAIISCIYTISLAPESGIMRTVLTPICSISIISLACPAFEPIRPNDPPKPDFPSILNIECTNLESLFEETVEGPGLALKMKQVEMETRDLVTVVRKSNLGLNSREIIVDSLGKFVKDARKVSRELTRFSSRVGVAMDNIIDSALSAIEAADAKSSAFSPSRLLQLLVHEAEVSLSDLNKLEEHLKSIHDVVSHEESPFTAAKEQIAQLLTKTHGDRKEFRGKRRALLKRVGKYRDRARGHVVAALHYLEKTVQDMEELRDRMTSPQLVGETVPIDIHIKRLRFGLLRLKERRASKKS